MDLEFSLVGARSVGSEGFCIPLFAKNADRGNALYEARCETDGDHGSNILDFDVSDLDPDISLDGDWKRQIGDAWIDVFLWKGSSFVGDPFTIITSLGSQLDSVKEHAPFSLLDLYLAAKVSGVGKFADRTREFIDIRLGEEGGRAFFIENVLRRYGRIAIRREYFVGGINTTIPQELKRIHIEELARNKFSLVFSEDPRFVANKVRRERISSEIKEVFQRLDLEVEIEGLGIEGEVEESSIADDVLSNNREMGRKVRTRRFGLVREIAIDLGTTNTRLFDRSGGLVLEEPTVVAQTRIKGKISTIAVGTAALEMEGRTSDAITVIRPLRDGAIADADAVAALLIYFIDKAGFSPTFIRPLDLIICVPAGSTRTERRAIRNAGESAGASKISIILQPLAAAIGAGIPVIEPVGSLILSIGGGTSEVAVISTRGLAYSKSSRVGGDKITSEIIQYLRRSHNLLIGTATAERIKRENASALPSYSRGGGTFLVRGRDLQNGVPKEIMIPKEYIYEVVLQTLSIIVSLVRDALESIGPELAADIVDGGIVVTGGGAKIPQLKNFLEEETGLPVRIADKPESVVAIGIGEAMRYPVYRPLLQEL